MVQIKDMAGEYEPIGVMPFRQAVREQFTRHRPAHIQPLTETYLNLPKDSPT